MVRKILIFALIAALLPWAAPIRAAQAFDGQEKEIVIRTIHVPHYDIWLHADGVTWEGGRPGEVCTHSVFGVLPKAIADKYDLAREPEVTTEITPELYAETLSPDLQQPGYWGKPWKDFRADVLSYRPLNLFQAEIRTAWLESNYDRMVQLKCTFELSPYAPREEQYPPSNHFAGGLSYVYPVDLRRIEERKGQRFEPKVEGWRWELPVVVTWYLKEKPKPPDFYVKSLNSGTGEIEEGKRYAGTVVFGLKNTVSGPVEAKLELTHNGYAISGVDGQVVTFQPGEEKSFTFNFTGQNRDSVLVAKIRPVEGNDANWNDNSRRVVVPLKLPEPPPGGGGNGLTFRAVSQTRSKARPAGTAKWTDWVTATFEPPKVDTVVREGERPDYDKVVAPPPPEEKGFASECGGADYSVLRSWRIVSAKLTYPRQNPDFTMGCPYPPLCGTSVLSGGRVITDSKKTVTVSMKPASDGHKATAEFQEMWALDGAPVYCLLEGRMMAENPQYYTLAVHDVVVEVKYEIVHHYEVCDEFGCWCETGVYGPYTYRYTMKGPFTGRLLVNGTGVDSRAM